MEPPSAVNDVPAIPQGVATGLTRSAIFLVVTINKDPGSRTAVRTLCGDLSGLIRSVGFREIDSTLSCVIGIGSDAWDLLFDPPRPAELHPFREIRAGPRIAVSLRAICSSISGPTGSTSALSWKRKSCPGSEPPFLRSMRCKDSDTSTAET